MTRHKGKERPNKGHGTVVDGQEESPAGVHGGSHQLCLRTEMQMCVVVVGYGGRAEIGGSRCCNLMMMLFLLSLKNHFKS